MNDKRTRLETVVRALMAKTLDNGATEAEAMAAAEKAKDLIDRYQLDMTPQELIEEGCVKVELTPAGGYEKIFYEYASTLVAQYCEVRLWRSGAAFRRGNSAVYCAVGLQSDTDFIAWLLPQLAAFAKQGAENYVLAQGVKNKAGSRESGHDSFGGYRYYQHGRNDAVRAKNDFVKHCALRIRERLAELIKARKGTRTATSNALVPIKTGLINDWMKDNNVNLVNRRINAVVRTGAAGNAGRSHGENASFGRPVGSNGGPVALIGRR